ncbi:type II toxin-antitoxin system VapC family toxin [Aurantimonas sp. VKM B-3413]|uniref:type II toxin-antitoxin system VapC family toxin n=1 Tax=Aurantimonas sp. VKM B-3413 TaxID=2779401 RepID=UPI001E3D3B26|nr:type II toxin-antitoxin system VapC family toxin [Aurantimonas sp. VKM B-3413]MCB8837377.1 type II toxin-antitoxin system VapC family toxin [Aurantimonas sp. VKM B-3413]
MNIIADTNLLLRAIVADDPASAAVALGRMRSCSSLSIPTVALCEFVWVAGRNYKSPRHAIASAIRNLLADPKVVCDRAAVEAGLAKLARGGDFADGVIAFEGQRLGGEVFATFDRKAAALLAVEGFAVDLLQIAP